MGTQGGGVECVWPGVDMQKNLDRVHGSPSASQGCLGEFSEKTTHRRPAKMEA